MMLILQNNFLEQVKLERLRLV